MSQTKRATLSTVPFPGALAQLTRAKDFSDTMIMVTKITAKSMSEMQREEAISQASKTMDEDVFRLKLNPIASLKSSALVISQVA